MSTPTPEILPCPFCGAQPDMIRSSDEGGEFAAVQCPACLASSRQHYFCGEDAAEHAAGAWNARHHKAVETTPPTNPLSPAEAARIGEALLVVKDQLTRMHCNVAPDGTLQRVALAMLTHALALLEKAAGGQ